MTSPDGPGHLTTEELFRQHAGFVSRFLSRLGVPVDQLEDALQEVFLVVHRNGGYKPGLAKPASYLGNIALRAAAKHRRRTGLARQRHADAPLEHMPGELEDPARSLQARQDLERLQRALERLPEELCTTLLLVEMEGESCVSVAAGLGCPVGTIYWRLHHARKALRVALRALEAPREKPMPEPLEERAQPARSWMILFGLDGFDGSEAARLLQLARTQRPPIAVETLLTRHRELVRAGAELPAWASGFTTHSGSWLSVVGVAPVALGVLASGAIVTAVMFASHGDLVPQAPAPSFVERSVEIAAAKVEPVAPSATEAPDPAMLAANHALLDDATPAVPSPKRPRAPRTGERFEQAAQLGGGSAHEVTAPPTVRDRASPDAPPSPAVTQLSAAPERTGEQVRAEPEERPREPAAEHPPIAGALTDEELAEMRAIARAERLLDEAPQRALALTRAMAAGYPNSRFREERTYVELMALEQLGRTGELRDKGSAFLSTYPAGLYTERVRKALAAKAIKGD